MEIKIPKLSLVVLIGPSGSGKSSFANKHFLPTEILSSDYCRSLVSDDENDQSVTAEAFEVLHFIAAKRLAAGKLTVIDATNVQKESRKPLVQLAREYHCLPCAIVFDMPRSLCYERNKDRDDRNFGRHVIQQQTSQMRRNMRSLKYEGFRHIYRLDSEEQVNESFITRTKLWNDRTEENGPFDIIGDVHGCCDELEELLGRLGYKVIGNSNGVLGSPIYSHPEGRKAVFVGDLVDRGPRNLDAIRIVHNMRSTDNALCVPGNHDMKFMRKLEGKDVQITHGLTDTLAEIDALPEESREQFKEEAREFLKSLVSHYMLDGGKLVVAHAGLKQQMQGRGSGKVRDFCLYGETTGETDEFGLPVRFNWAAEYRGPAVVVYGHTPVVEPQWLNRTVNIDTGCVYGGKLTALRYPEKEFVQVPSKKIYCESKKPTDFGEGDKTILTEQHRLDDLLDSEDVLNKRIILTRLRSNITIRQENASAALEVMSRFTIDPKWLVYLPPTMSPSEASSEDGYLEYPSEAFDYFRKQGVPKVICEQKHMGSRAVVVICEEPQVSVSRFGIIEEKPGVIYTRTGRSFFSDENLEYQFLVRLKKAMDKADFWNEFETDWACLDCELMPWSEKAKELLKTQYAAVGSSATTSLSQTVKLLKKTKDRDGLKSSTAAKTNSSFDTDINILLERFAGRQKLIKKYISAYRQYCWPVKSINDYKLAPFHLMATEKGVHVDRDHKWHMETLSNICEYDKDILLQTTFKTVDVTDKDSITDATKWWENHTGRGGEGMVVKPLYFIAKGKRGLLQPALKCRGREYLRIIYGPEYTNEENLQRLRNRGLAAKRSLALREFALGIEGLERVIRKEPLRRVHECVFGVLALESEPVDPRL